MGLKISTSTELLQSFSSKSSLSSLMIAIIFFTQRIKYPDLKDDVWMRFLDIVSFFSKLKYHNNQEKNRFRWFIVSLSKSGVSLILLSLPETSNKQSSSP
jgi:hypothetical protein